MLLPATASTKPTIALFKPVEDTAPTIMPADATATPIVTIFLVPEIIPDKISAKPLLTASKVFTFCLRLKTTL